MRPDDDSWPDWDLWPDRDRWLERIPRPGSDRLPEGDWLPVVDVPAPVALFVDRNFVAILAVLVILAAGAGYVAATGQGGPDTRIEQRTVERWTVETGFDHRATVQRDATVFDRGDTLDNRPLYFTDVAPILEGAYTVSHDGDADSARAGVRLRLVIRSEGTVDGEHVVHWEYNETIANETVADLEPGETLRVPFEANVTDLNQRRKRIENDLGASPATPEIYFEAETTVEATGTEEAFADQRTDRLVIQPGGSTYRVTAESQGARTHEVTEAVAVQVGTGSTATVSGTVLSVLSLAAAAGLVYARRRGLFEVPPDVVARIEHRQAREDFGEWISTGTVPETDDRTTVTLDSLQDVVDVAIDGDRRVIEHEDRRYVVLVEDVRYEYDAPFDSLDGIAAAPEVPTTSDESVTDGAETGSVEDGRSERDGQDDGGED